MSRSSGQKLKLLYLRDYLLHYSDQAHPVTVEDMAEHLSSLGISADRKILYDDMDALESYGLDIVRTKKGRANGYYIGSRDFQLPEVKLLVDAVQSSRFITQAKTMSLIKRIEGLASVYEGRSLQRQVVVQNRVKSMNESVYYNVDAISDAIGRGVVIMFKYFEYGPDKARRYRHDGRDYRVCPEFLVWDDENYYMVACPVGTREPRHYRVDKMSDIRLTLLDAGEKTVDPAEYTNSLFGMYHGDREKVTLRFKNALSGVAVDRFGKDLIFSPDGENHFTLTAEVAVSPQFLAWLAALGDGVEIVSPPGVRAQMRLFLKQSLRIYEPGQ